VHLLELTPSGEARRRGVQTEIRRNEDRFLARLPRPDRDALVRSLQALAGPEPGS
jgi:hypothetical protein